MRLAKLLGVNQPHISNIERGARSVTIQQLTKLSKEFGVSIDQLLQDRQEKVAAAPRSLRSGRLLRRLQRIEELPAPQQQAILKILDGLLSPHRRDNGRAS
jgi:transcriptional regulator with XRE-family HTH domain